MARTLTSSMDLNGQAPTSQTPKRQLYPTRPNLNLNSPTVRRNPSNTQPILLRPLLAGGPAGSSTGDRHAYSLNILLAIAKKPASQDEDSLIGAITLMATDAASFRKLYKHSPGEFQEMVHYVHKTLGVCGLNCICFFVNTSLYRRTPLPD